MNEKRNAVVTIAMIFSIIVAFTVADFLQGDVLFSPSENRILAQKPELAKENLLDGTFAEDYEVYVSDQFVGRDKWIAVKTETDVLLQKQEINGVYLGKDGYLFEQHKPEDYPEKLEEEKLALLKKVVDRWGARVMLVPTADNILTDKLPANAPYYDETRLLAKTKNMLAEYHYIDAYSILQEHSQEEIYYRTDHHWTSLGAYYGYRQWANTVHRYPLLRDVQARTQVSDNFLGTLHSAINRAVQPDRMEYYPETEQKPVQVTYDFGRTATSFYEEKQLDTKNKYAYFLDDNHAFVEIQTSNPNGKSLFVIKDSYANCLIPLLAQHYEKVYVVDPRYLNTSLFDFMEKYEQQGEMEVLVIYNCIHFLEDFNYIE